MFLCWGSLEDINNLCVHCPFSQELWYKVIGVMGVQWVFPGSIMDLLLSNMGGPISKERKILGKVAVSVVLLSIWIERNTVIGFLMIMLSL